MNDIYVKMLSVTELAIEGKQRKTHEKELLVKDQIYCTNSTIGNSGKHRKSLISPSGRNGR